MYSVTMHGKRETHNVHIKAELPVSEAAPRHSPSVVLKIAGISVIVHWENNERRGRRGGGDVTLDLSVLISNSVILKILSQII